MIRNNNVAAGKGSIEGYDTYFMLDYFDLLCHRHFGQYNWKSLLHTPQALLQHPAPSDKPYAQNISE